MRNQAFPTESGRRDLDRGPDSIDLSNILVLPPRPAGAGSKLRRYRAEILIAGIVLSWGLVALPLYALTRLL